MVAPQIPVNASPRMNFLMQVFRLLPISVESLQMDGGAHICNVALIHSGKGCAAHPDQYVE